MGKTELSIPNVKLPRIYSKREKIIRFIFISFFVGIIFISVSMLSVVLLVPNIGLVRGENIILGAHRGNSVDYVENTIPAFESAVQEDKYKFIEFDVQYTKDMVPVVYHDRTLSRLQKQNYAIAEVTYGQLQEISRYKIPTYEEVMEIVAGKKPIVIEIKPQGNETRDEILGDFLIQDLTDRGLLHSTLIISLSSPALKHIKKVSPTTKTGKVYYVTESTFIGSEFLTSDLYEEMDEYDIDYLMLHGSNLRNYETLRELLPQGKVLSIWYLTDEMYIMQEEPDFGPGISSLKPKLRNLFLELFGKKPEPCIWWCEWKFKLKKQNI